MKDPNDFIIKRKRKKYRFALFHNSPLCFEAEEWPSNEPVDVVEIGAGTGLLSVALAERYPERSSVAVDVKADRLQVGARHAEASGLGNVRFLRARADQILQLLRPKSCREIWITFPDPFPRQRSAKHRLTHELFLDRYRTLLTADGSVLFKTDARALFQWSLETLVIKNWAIEELSFDLHETGLNDDYKIMTTYEQRFVKEGLTTYFVRATPPKA